MKEMEYTVFGRKPEFLRLGFKGDKAIEKNGIQVKNYNKDDFSSRQTGPSVSSKLLTKTVMCEQIPTLYRF